MCCCRVGLPESKEVTQPIKNSRLGKRKQPSPKPECDTYSHLMHNWLQSQIDKNVAKQSLMAAEKELIELKKRKLELEIRQLETVTQHEV